MKVTHIFKTYFPDTQGGIEEVIRQISRYSDGKGIRNTVLTVSPQLNRNNNIIYYSGTKVIRYKSNVNLFSTPISKDFLINFSKEISEADLLHFHYPWPFGEICYLMNKKKPSLVTYHSDIIKQKNIYQLYQPFMKKFLDKVDIIVPTSGNYLKSSDVLRKYRYKCIVIPLGIDESRFPEEKTEITNYIEKQYGSDFFLFVGVLRYYKGIEFLVKAMKSVNNNLLIVGNGPEKKRIETIIKKYKINNVKMLGFVDDKILPSLFKLSKAFVFPSCERSEAFGVSLLESAFYGKPMISTELMTGTSFVNKNDVTGIVVPPKNQNELSNALNKLNNNKEICEKYGINAKNRFEKKFKISIVGEEYLKLYNQII